MSWIVDLLKGPNIWPIIMILFGGTLTLAGGFWCNFQQGVADRALAESIRVGDSFCYLDVTSTDGDKVISAVVHNGKYPLYDVKLDVVDLDRFDSRNFFQDRKLIEIGNLLPGRTAAVTAEWQLPKDKDQARFNVFISTRNRSFAQELRMAKVHGKWQQATRLFRSGGKVPQPIYQRIPNDYPRNKAGDIDW